MIEDHFEDRLLAELHQIIATRRASNVVAFPAARRRSPLLYAGMATAAAATAAVLAVTGGGASPAFAVMRQPNGDLTVTINQLSDAQGLQRELRAAGVNAEVDYTPAGKTCREPRGHTPGAASQGLTTAGVRVKNGGLTTFTVSRNVTGPGKILVIATSGGEGPTSVGMEVVQGPVSPCVLVASPAPPPGAVFATHGQAGGTSAGPGTGRGSQGGPNLNRAP